jgi:transcriptional regulator with XRE-family HTH domain
MIDFGKRLKQERLLWGMTQGDLAEQTGLDRSAVSRLENGERKPQARELTAFAKLFQTTVDDLLGTANAGSVRCRVNSDSPSIKQAIEWFERCVDNSLFVHSLPEMYARNSR